MRAVCIHWDSQAEQRQNEDATCDEETPHHAAATCDEAPIRNEDAACDEEAIRTAESSCSLPAVPELVSATEVNDTEEVTGSEEFMDTQQWRPGDDRLKDDETTRVDYSADQQDACTAAATSSTEQLPGTDFQDDHERAVMRSDGFSAAQVLCSMFATFVLVALCGDRN